LKQLSLFQIYSPKITFTYLISKTNEMENNYFLQFRNFSLTKTLSHVFRVYKRTYLISENIRKVFFCQACIWTWMTSCTEIDHFCTNNFVKKHQKEFIRISKLFQKSSKRVDQNIEAFSKVAMKKFTSSLKVC